MEFKIMIDQFEGPLDLMLHLIRENKLDLFDLDMNVLTEQYLAYLDAMESMHLERLRKSAGISRCFRTRCIYHRLLPVICRTDFPFQAS